MVEMIEEAATGENYIYDVYDRRGKPGVFYKSGTPHTLGVVGAKSRQEAYNKACAAFCKTGLFAHPKPKHIIVAIRAEVNFRPAKSPLTAKELRVWQSGLVGITPGTDKIITCCQEKM